MKYSPSKETVRRREPSATFVVNEEVAEWWEAFATTASSSSDCTPKRSYSLLLSRALPTFLDLQTKKKIYYNVLSAPVASTCKIQVELSEQITDCTLGEDHYFR